MLREEISLLTWQWMKGKAPCADCRGRGNVSAPNHGYAVCPVCNGRGVKPCPPISDKDALASLVAMIRSTWNELMDACGKDTQLRADGLAFKLQALYLAAEKVNTH